MVRFVAAVAAVLGVGAVLDALDLHLVNALVSLLVAIGLAAALGFDWIEVGAGSKRPRLAFGLTVVFSFWLLLTAFAALYTEMSESNPRAFADESDPRPEPLTWVDARYLSAATMTTTGFGDVRPSSQGARIAAMGQMAVAIMFGTVVLTKLGTKPAASSD